MITDILNGLESSLFVLIQDDIQTSGFDLLKVFTNSAILRTDKIDCVEVVLYENYIHYLTDSIQSFDNRLKVHDVASDVLAWKSPGGLTLESDIYKHVIDSNQHNNVTLVIDGLSSLILHRTPAYTCQVLNKFMQSKHRTGVNFNQLVCLVHKDLHDEQTLNLLHHTASTIITLNPPRSRDYSATCSILHKKSSGKIVRSMEEFKISGNYTIEETRAVSQLTIQQQHMNASQPDPTANLTFNLSLSESEKQARSEMHLPYMKHKPRVESKSGGDAKIFYQPDEADDFDEEDPDDDLDI